MKLIRLLGLLLLLFTFAGCKDEDTVEPTCENYVVNLGPFYLAQSSKNSYPYSATDSNLVFRNQFDEELVLTRSFSFQDTFGFTFHGECPFDTTVDVPYMISIEQMSVTFKNDSLDLSAYFSFQGAYKSNNGEVTGESDIANFHLQRLTSGHSTSVSSILNYKSGERILFLTKYFDSITLGSKTFTNVYSNFPIPQNPPEFLVYMNYDIGIVGFEITSTGTLWVFDHIE